MKGPRAGFCRHARLLSRALFLPSRSANRINMPNGSPHRRTDHETSFDPVCSTPCGVILITGKRGAAPIPVQRVILVTGDRDHGYGTQRGFL